MKVAVTGHTKGIGQGLYQHFQSQGHEVLGFSRSNGFTLPVDELRVLHKIRDCDIFVNNSLPVTSQISLLKKLWPLWINHNKKIIVIGSVGAHMPSNPELQDYQQQKKELDNLCKSLRYESDSAQCLLISIHPGFVATDIFIEYNLQPPPAEECLSVAQVVDIVDYAINSPIKIDDIVFRR